MKLEGFGGFGNYLDIELVLFPRIPTEKSDVHWALEGNTWRVRFTIAWGCGRR